MIDFYTYGSINGRAVAIALEEMQVPYQAHAIDLMQGEQRTESFLAINPSGRIPVIVDHLDSGDLVLSQTGAILVYLAEKTGQLLGDNAIEKAHIIQWLMFQLTDISVNLFNNFYLKSLIKDKQPAAGDALKQRAMAFFKEHERQLGQQEFLCGQTLSVADLACYPAVAMLVDDLLDEKHPNLARWFDAMSQRPAIKKGMALFA